jgi:hypothetical protein
MGIFPAQPVIFVMLQCLAIKVNAGALPGIIDYRLFLLYIYYIKKLFSKNGALGKFQG